MAGGLHVHSEIGELRRVMLHRPAGELLNLSPDTLGPLLFDDIPFLRVAQEEHDAFAGMLRQEGVEVVYLEDLVAEALDAHPEARRAFCERWLDESGVDGAGVRSAVSELLDSLPPSTHASLADLMALSAGRMGELVIDPIPNVYFTRDTFSVIGQGVSHNRMWSATRRRESIFGDFLFAYHPDYAGTPSWYSSDQPYHIEGGDILVLSAECVGIGISERTQAAGIDALAKRLLWAEPDSGVRRVLAFSLPHKRSFMHLDTVFTQADVDIFTVHPAILGTLTVFELTRGARVGEVSIRQLDQTLDAILARALGLDGVRLIKCGGDDAIAAAREQWNDGSNTLAVRPGTVMVYQRNTVTNDILCREGLNLLEVPSAELSRGRGGPHCMSMAFWREDL